jgi:hypothetical protein
MSGKGRCALVRPIADILNDIEAFAPRDGNWLPLDRLFDELWQHDFPTSAIPVLFRVFERFPDEDGAGVLWSIVHGLERRNDYEVALTDSLARQPSEMGNLMLQRLERSKSK